MEEIRNGFNRVTSVLGFFQDFSKIPEEVLAAACDRGTEAHSAIEAWHQYHYESDNPYLRSYLKWHELCCRKVIEVEPRLYDDDLLLTGRIDLVCTLPNERGITLVDYKTGKSKSKAWPVQMGAYYLLYCANRDVKFRGINRALILQLDENGNAPKVTEYGRLDLVNYGELFMNCYKTWRHFNA